jgi:alpha-tubulin suppressor-like RCC1 family protein
MGFNQGAAVKTNGTLWAWGVNSLGNLGLNDIVSRSSPVQIGSATTWKTSYGSIASGSGVLLALRS